MEELISALLSVKFIGLCCVIWVITKLSKTLFERYLPRAKPVLRDIVLPLISVITGSVAGFIFDDILLGFTAAVFSSGVVATFKKVIKSKV